MSNNNNNMDDEDYTIEEIELYLEQGYGLEYGNLISELYVEYVKQRIDWDKQQWLNDFGDGTLADKWNIPDDENDQEEYVQETYKWANSKMQVDLRGHDEMLDYVKELETEDYERRVCEMFIEKRNEERNNERNGNRN